MYNRIRRGGCVAALALAITLMAACGSTSKPAVCIHGAEDDMPITTSVDYVRCPA